MRGGVRSTGAIEAIWVSGERETGWGKWMVRVGGVQQNGALAHGCGHLLRGREVSHRAREREME